MIRRELEQQLKNINQLMQEVNGSLERAPKGRLRCQMVMKKYPVFYLIMDELAEQYPHGRYLHKEESDLARQLVQKEYDQKLFKELQHQQRTLNTFLKQYHDNSLPQIYSQFPEAKKRIIQPRILPDDQFIQAWYKAHPGEQNPAEVNNENHTERGEIARSKSEKMIADKLFYMHIPYVYEPRLRVITNEDFYPDFLILNVRERKEFYHEHLGLMDDPNYVKKVVRKLNTYEMSGIYLGENLTLTMECDGRSFNAEVFDSILRRCFL